MKVLLIPEQFPTQSNPVAGIFMQDYIQSISGFAEPEVFFTNPYFTGERPVNQGDFPLHFHFYGKQKPAGVLKLFSYFLWEKAAFAEAKKLSKPDLIHLHGAALRGNLAIKLSKFWKVPLVVTEHTGPWSSISSRPQLLKRAKKAIEFADAFLPVSRHLLQEVRQSGINPKHTEALGNPVDTNFFIQGPDLTSRSKKFLFIGRLDEFKGGLRTVKAFAKIATKLPEWQLTLAGDGEEKSAIEDFVAQQQLQNKVHLLPFQTRQGMLKLYQQSACVVFPSRFESFGLVAAEALSTGTPLLCTDQTGPKDFFNTNSGFWINPDNTEDIAEKMLQFAEKFPDFDTEKIRQHLLSGYGSEAFSKKLETVYKKVLLKL